MVDSCPATLCQVLEHFFDVLLPKAGVSEGDRKLLKTSLENHTAYRSHSAGDGGDCTWQASLQKSGIMAFELVSELVYGKQHDHTVRQAAKQGAVEALMEHENVKELWSQAQSQLANEAAERLALQKGQNAAAESEPEEEVVLIRKNPQSFALHSPSYWRAVANASVRAYVSVMPEPKTTDGVAQAISQCNLKSIRGNLGESCILLHLDLDLLGETWGPSCQPLLRKQFQPQFQLLSKLCHGAMVARGSQKNNDAGEATAVVEGDIVAIHCGMDRTKKEAKNLFKAGGGKKVDSELKDTTVCFNDESLRARKRRVKGSYSGVSHLLFASSSCISQSVPERTFQNHSANSWPNVVPGVMALPPSELWHTSRQRR